MSETVAETCRRIHSLVCKHFKYVSDKKNYREVDHWKSHAQAVNEGNVFKDDCDGFALTCAELLIEAGINRSRIRALICRTETGEQHLVCGVDVPENKSTIILDNRFKKTLDWKSTGYNWEFSMRFSEPGVWYKIED